MKPLQTIGLVVILAVLGLYVFLYEREPISTAPEQKAKINIVSVPTAEVTQIQVDQNAPAASVTLVKKESGWQFADGKAAETSRIEGVLQQLAPWQAEAKLEDQVSAERLSEFGLEPPELLVRISTKSGDKVLKIGKKTPTSSGYYAKVEGDTSLYLSYVNVPEDLLKLISEPPLMAKPIAAGSSQP